MMPMPTPSRFTARLVVLLCLLSGTAWAGNDSSFRQFDDWRTRFTNAAPSQQSALLTEGAALAKQRHAAMKELIRQNPALALAQAVTPSHRRHLPDSVASWVEDWVTGNADVLMRPAGTPTAGVSADGLAREVHINGKVYAAHVFGWWLVDQDFRDTPVNGIVVDGVMVLAESPVRRLSREEVPAGLWREGKLNVQHGKETRSFDSEQQLADFERRLMYPTGMKVPGPRELAEQAKIKQIRRVHPNELAWQRINAKRQKKGLAPLSKGELGVVPMGSEFELEDSAAPTARAAGVGTVGTPAPMALSPTAGGVDNSALNYFPPIGNQGSLGSCAAFSTTYYQMTHMTAMARGWNAKTGGNSYRFSPKWTYNMVNGGSDNGSTEGENINVQRDHGCATWAEFPYTGNSSDYLAWCTNGTIWSNAISRRMNSYSTIGSLYTSNGLANLKAVLDNGYVCTFDTYAPWSYQGWVKGTVGTDPATTNNPYAGQAICTYVRALDWGHAMTIVGYDDDIWVDLNTNGVVDPGEKGALKIANNWGTGWGNSGYAWIAYDALNTTSSVSGWNPADKVYGFGYGDSPSGVIAYVVTAQTNYSPKMIAQVTVNHPFRNQMTLKVGKDNTTVTNNPSTTWTGYGLSGDGGAYAFDGTTNACDGTFCLDLTGLNLNLATQNRYFFGMTDSSTSGSGVIKSVTFIDVARSQSITVTPAANPASFNPGTGVADNTTAWAWVDYVAGVSIVLSGTTLTAESCLPTNGVIDPGETVTVQFALTNNGNGNTANLVATLLPVGGVTYPSGPQTYGAMTNGAAAVSRPFTFVASGTCGGTIQAVLQLQDGTNNYGYITNSFTLGAVVAVLTQNFDGVTVPALPAGWTTSAGGGQSNWVTSTAQNDTSPNSAFSPDPASVGSNQLVSTTFSITTTNAQLNFGNYYNTESTYDGAVLEIKIGGGNWQDIIAAGGSWLAGGYNATLDATYGNPYGGRQAWSGNSGGFITTTVKLPASAAGQTVQLRWCCGSDSSNAGSGWWVDSIIVTEPDCCSGGASYKAALANLVPNAGTLNPAFAFNLYSYTASVPYTTTNLILTPTAVDTNATITINGSPVASANSSTNINLNIGTNSISTVVVANDLSATNTYTLVVIRSAASTNAYLANLVASTGTFSPTFASNTFSYTANVPYATNNLTVTPTVADSTATIMVNGSPVVSGNASGTISLSVGTNVITTVVTAQNPSVSNTYTLTVTRAVGGTNAYLTNLVPSAGTLTPAFASGSFSYTNSVTFASGSLTVTPTAADTNAIITVNGSPVPSGNPSGNINLNVGTNFITTVVVSEDQSLTNTYTLTVTRAASISRWWDGGSTNNLSTGDGISDGGNGIWDTATQNWDQGSGQIYVAWDNTTGNIAIFGGTGGTVTLTTNITVGGLNLTNTYTIANTTGASLNFATAGTICNSATVTIAPPLTGTGPITKTGAGTLTLNSSNSYTGGTILNAGSLTVTTNYNLGDTSGGITFSGSATIQSGALALSLSNRPITLNNSAIATFQAQHVNNTGKVFAIPGYITGGGGMVAFDDYTLGQYNVNSTCTTNDFKGSISVGNLATQGGSVTLNIASLQDGVGYGNIIFGLVTTPTFNYTGSSSLTLNNRRIELGSTKGGILSSGGSGVIAVNTDLLVSGTGAQTLTLGGSNTGNNTFAGKIANGSGAITLTKTGTGTWALSGTNTYTGQTVVKGGTLILGNSNAMAGSTGFSIQAASTIQAGIPNLNVVTAGTYSNGGNEWSAGWTVAGTNSITFNTGFAQYLNNSTIISNNLSGGSTLTFASGLALNTSSTAAATQTFTGSGNTLISGAIIDSTVATTYHNKLTYSGTGTLALSGTNSYSGGTTVSAGILEADNSAAVGTGLLTLSGGGLSNNVAGVVLTNTVNLASSVIVGVPGGTNFTLGGAVTNLGALTKVGAGTLTLTNANTYSGATTVSGGTLLINGNSIAVTNAVTVQTNATFGGTGTIGGVVKYQKGSLASFTLTPEASDTYNNSTYMTFTNAVFLTNVTVGVSMPTNLGNGTYVLATNYATWATNGSLTFATNSGSLGTNGSGSVSVSGNNLILKVSGVSGGQTASTWSYSNTGPFAYDGTAKTPAISFSGSTGTKTTNYVGTGTTTYASVNAPTNAGTFYVSNTVVADSNYFGATNSQGFTIKAPGNFSGISVSGTGLTLNVTNGTPGGTWTLLESTNMLLPVGQWKTNRTGTYGGSGNLTTNIWNAATNPAAFYLLK